jgi:hypothetical protein
MLVRGAGLAGLLLLALCPAAASARDLYVAPNGSDGAPGTAARPLRTVTEAWRRVPAKPKSAITIQLRAGTWTSGQVPEYWERRAGSLRRAPIRLRSADGRGRAVLPGMNVFRVSGLILDGVRLQSGGDVFHCELCSGLRIQSSDLIGSRAGSHENIKVNQSRDVAVRDSLVSGAEENTLDFVAVRDVRLTGNVFEKSGDWCAYTKGGSANVVVTGNVFRDCGTGGFTAGQGTGLQYMVAPFLHYEAVGVVVAGNTFRDIDGAAFGVNGAYDALFTRNVAYRTGARSHLFEAVAGSRSCDAGDDSRRCPAKVRAGAWGPARPGDDAAVSIPNRHVYVIGNVFANPADAPTRWQQFQVTGDLDRRGNVPANLARGDADLRIAGNVISNGPADHPLGLGDGNCPAASSCAPDKVGAENAINTLAVEVREAGGGRLTAVVGGTQPAAQVPAPVWTDRPRGEPALWRSWPR